MRLHEIQKTLNPPSISVGDEVKVGKFKNRKAEVKGFTKDDHGQPVLKTTKGDQKLYKPRVSKLEPKEVNENEYEITFDWKDRIHDTGDILYARNPQSHKVVQVTVTDGKFMGKQYQVTYKGDPEGGGNGGMWAANNEDLFKTRETAESAMFLKQLTRKGG